VTGFCLVFPGGNKLVENAHCNGALDVAAEPRIYRHGVAQVALFLDRPGSLRILHEFHCRLFSRAFAILSFIRHPRGGTRTYAS